MKRYIALFEKFEEGYDKFHQAPNMKSDPIYHNITQELIDLANQYATSPIEIDQHTEKYETHTRIKDLQNDLILKINNLEGEDIAQSFADESDTLLASLNISEKKKGLWDNINAKRKRGEKPAKPGDKSYPDAKALKSAQKTEESMNKNKVFSKTSNIPDNGILSTPSKKSNMEKGKSVQSLRPHKTTR